MNTISIILFLSMYTLHVHGAQSAPPVFIHHKHVQSQAGTRVKLHNYKPHAIDVTYIPQQIVNVKNTPTKLPFSRHTYSTGAQHLKCVISNESPQKKTDRTTLELLVRQEPLGKAMAQLLDKEAALKGHEAVVRLYRKVATDTNPTSKSCWKPILTLPKTGNTDKLLESIRVSPDGKIHLENS